MKIEKLLSRIFKRKIKAEQPKLIEIEKTIEPVIEVPKWKLKLKSRYARLIHLKNGGSFVNPESRRRKAHRIKLGIRTNKQYRKLERKARRKQTTIERLLGI